MTFLYDQVVRRLAPRLPVELPPRAHVRGVEFVEFAANETEIEQLEKLFAALGFHPAGRHRTKNVTRWRQNGINFVLDAEPDSFARPYDSVHGASVCAIGLSTENVGGTLKRAEGLQIGQFSQAIAPGEMKIPSIYGVGGSLIYFLEAGSESEVWDTDFAPDPGRHSHQGAGLLRVDHIAQIMQHDENLVHFDLALELYGIRTYAERGPLTR